MKKIWSYTKGWFKWFYGKGNKRYSIPYVIMIIIGVFFTAATWFKFGRACESCGVSLKEAFFGKKPDPEDFVTKAEDEEDIFAE